jgi:Haem-binding domain
MGQQSRAEGSDSGTVTLLRCRGWSPQHVNQGREMLNFSDWDAHQPTANEMEELCDAVSSGSMPLRSYTLIHRKAILSKRDVDTICKLADRQPSSTAQLSSTLAALTPSKEKRKKETKRE